MSVYGYCRISTPQQNIERQVRNISDAYPSAHIVREVYTGTASQGRRELDKLLHVVQAGDTIVFDSVSRMSRSAEEGCALYEALYNRGVTLCFLKEPHINAPVRRRHGAALCPQGVQAQTRALLIPGFHGIQAVGAQPGNMAGLYGAAYQALQTR